MSQEHPFANVSREDGRKARELEERRFSELRASLTRLVKSEDFRMWFQYVNWNLFGEAAQSGELDAFTQGKRSVMGFLKRSIAIADGGPEFLGDLTRRYFTAVAEAKSNAQRNNDKIGE